MRDTHRVVINDRSKMICWELVGLYDDRVCRQRCVRVFQSTKNEVHCGRSGGNHCILDSQA